MTSLRKLKIAAAMALLGGPACSAPLDYPATPKRPVQDSYHGVTVSEDYRWLEDLASPEVTDWVAAQNRLTRQVLDALPGRQAVRDELQRMVGSGRASRSSFQTAGGALFALKRQPPKAQALLVVMDGADPAREKVLLDPMRLDGSGKTAIDWYRPSPDGRLVAVSLSKNGSDDGTLHIVRRDTGELLADRVPRVQYPTGGGSVSWTADSQGLYYTRYPQGDERPAADANFYQQVWFHQLGTPATQDRYVIGRDFPRIAEIALSASEDRQHLLATVSNGDGGEHSFHLRSGDGPWRRIAADADGVRRAAFGPGGRLYALVLKGSPRGRIVAMNLADPGADLAGAPTVVPEGDAVIQALRPTATRLYLELLVGGPSELRAYTLAGQPLGAIAAQPVATATLGAWLGGDKILFGSESYTSAFRWYTYDGSKAGAKPQATKLSDPPPFAVRGGLPGYESVREFAVSKDGTRVPMTIVRRKGQRLNGQQPVLLTGYGGFGISLRPSFNRNTVAWLRHGGIYVRANLRAGGEFGNEWHRAGQLTRKQNVFDDFIACAEHLIARGYTQPAKLGIQGGSNGGLLMGAVANQRPDLFGAVVSGVGVYDMLRVETTPNGAFNVTEFGSVKVPEQFKALHAYSPLHRVQDGAKMPAMLLTTGLHDGRVAPWMSFKMAARLQAATVGNTASGRPVLLRVAADAGHGQGTRLASSLDLQADELAFFFSQLGMR